jgi:hypothetical protein
MRKPDPASSEQVPLRDYLDSKVDHLESLINANADLAHQRFEDQDKAVLAALAAQEKAVAAALAAQEKSSAAALASADRAVTKAELAAGERFAAVNEFRAQLSDQASTFMSRAEALLQINANAEKIDALSARMDRGEGGHAAAVESRSEQRQSQAAGISQGVLVFMGVSILISIAALITSIILHH